MSIQLIIAMRGDERIQQHSGFTATSITTSKAELSRLVWLKDRRIESVLISIDSGLSPASSAAFT